MWEVLFLKWTVLEPKRNEISSHHTRCCLCGFGNGANLFLTCLCVLAGYVTSFII